ncbi:MAG TPA: hypothetical protein VF469_20385 [Kofleriaceae bacterium]
MGNFGKQNLRAAIYLAASLAACASSARQEPPINAARAQTQAGSEKQPMTGVVSPAGNKHPGQIVYDDRVEHRTWTENAASVPPTMAWVKVHDQWKPVVRIEITGAGDTREMTSFGPNHEFLETTTATLSGAPPSQPMATPTPVPTPAPTPKQ